MMFLPGAFVGLYVWFGLRCGDGFLVGLGLLVGLCVGDGPTVGLDSPVGSAGVGFAVGDCSGRAPGGWDGSLVTATAMPTMTMTAAEAPAMTNCRLVGRGIVLRSGRDRWVCCRGAV
jgi:hypothetical protein